MTASQVVLYSVLLIVLVSYMLRRLRMRSIKQYAPAEVATKLKDSRNTLLLDVRSLHERKLRYIKSSLHIPLHELRKRSVELNRMKDKEIICYCQSGSRSLSAAAILRRQGFNVANMRGGIASWNFSGLK